MRPLFPSPLSHFPESSTVTLAPLSPSLAHTFAHRCLPERFLLSLPLVAPLHPLSEGSDSDAQAKGKRPYGMSSEGLRYQKRWYVLVELR